MFLERSASLRVSPSSSTARTVIEGHRDPVDLVAVERPVGERIGGVPRLLQVPLRERVLVHDDRPALLDRAELGLQGRRVHRDQDVRVVAGRQDVGRGELDLERRDAVDGAGRGPDLGREVRHRREVVAQDRRGIGEPVPRQLHPVAGIAGEPDHDALLLLHLLGHRRRAWPGRLLRIGS
jgi:hypothetical protein